MRYRIFSFALSFCLVFLLACSGGSTASGGGSSAAFSLSPGSGSVLLGKSVQVSASSTATAWTVDGVAGGNAQVGTISNTGVYTAPVVLPSPSSVTIGASSGTQTATASVAVQSDIAVTLAAPPASTILTGSTVTLMPTITSAGAPSTAVLWTVSGVANGNSSVGTVSVANGTTTYTAPAMQPTGPVQLVATSAADPSKSATLTLTVQGILLSAASGVPGAEVTLMGHFDTTQPLNVMFADAGSYKVVVPVTPVAANAAVVTLPTYVSGTVVGTAGTVSVSAIQGTQTLGSSTGFALQALPTASGNPGDVTLLYLQSLMNGVDAAQHLWDTLASASNGALSVAASDAATADKQAKLATLVDKVKAASATPYVFGQQGTTALQLDASTVKTLDSILQAYVINNPKVIAATTARLARSHVSFQGLSPIERVRAEFSLGNLSGTDLFGSAVVTLAVVANAPEAALFMGALLIRELYLETHRSTVATEAASGQSLADKFSILQNFENQFTAIIQGDQITLDANTTSLNADSSAEVAQLNSANNSSELSTLEVHDSAIVASETVPSANVVPVIRAVAQGVLSTGETLYKFFFFGAPNTVYSLSPSWSSSTTVQTDYFGYASASFVVPAPSTGTTCYNGSVSLANAGGTTVATDTDCFGPQARITIFLRPYDYLLTNGINGQVNYSVSGITVASLTLRYGVQTPAFEICNVPAGRTFQLDYTTTNVKPGPDTGLWGLVGDNATVGGSLGIPSLDHIGLPSGSVQVTTVSSCPTGGCATSPYQGTVVRNTCVTIPGLND